MVKKKEQSNFSSVKLWSSIKSIKRAKLKQSEKAEVKTLSKKVKDQMLSPYQLHVGSTPRSGDNRKKMLTDKSQSTLSQVSLINMSKDQSINLEIDLAHFKQIADILERISEELETMDFKVIEGLGEDDEILHSCTHWWEIAKGSSDFMNSIHNSIRIAQNEKVERELIISMTFQLL